MCPFALYDYHVYIMVCVYYVTKWIKVTTGAANDGQTASNYLKTNVFARFGVSKVLIRDEGMHFCNKYLEGVSKNIM